VASFQIWKPAQQRGSHEFKMTDHRRKLFEPSLTVGYLGVEKILMMAPLRLAIHVFICRRPDRNGRSGQHIVDPAAQA